MTDLPSNIRYAKLDEHPNGGILFDWHGHTIRIAENEQTVCLVGHPRAAEIIARDYAFLLAHL